MVLTENDIKDYILNPYNKSLIDYHINIKKKLDLHINGAGLESFVKTVDKVENKDYIKLKKKLANAITVKIFEKCLRPVDRVFNAKGGMKIFNFNNSDKENQLKDILQTAQYSGLNFQTYLHKIWGEVAIWLDPLSITLVEVNDEADLYLKFLSVYDRVNETYSTTYHDLQFKQYDEVCYLILNEGNDDKYDYYRVIDDEKDLIARKPKDFSNQDKIEILDDSIIYHKFGRVPAVFNSNKINKNNIGQSFSSYCQEAMVVADNYLNDYIDYRIYKKKLGIPRFWEFKTQCMTCSGTGTVLNTQVLEVYTDGQQYITCPACGGRGYDTERNLTDIFRVDLLERDVQNYIPPTGAVTLPVEIQTKMTEELERMEEDIYDTLWGQGTFVQRERANTTAFEIATRNENLLNKLQVIAKNKTDVEAVLIDFYGLYYFPNDYQSVFITPPNQYVTSSATEARTVYLDAKTKKSSSFQLDKLYKDYLLAEYENNPIEYEKQIKMLLINPLPHLDIIESKDLLTPIEFLIKKNFEKYVYRYESTGGSINDDKIENINTAFVSYAQEEMPKENIDTKIKENEKIISTD